MSFDLEKIKEELSKNPGIMLEELTQRISQAFWIRADVIRDILKNESLKNLSSLRKELSNWEVLSKDNQILSQEDIEKLITVIKWAREFIKTLSKQEIQDLKKELDWINIWDLEDYISSKILPRSLIIRAQNPQTVGDQITGACIWIINSTQKIVEFLYLLWKWIIKTPIDIYLIISWKGEYPTWKRI